MTSPGAFRRKLADRARNHARATNDKSAELLLRWYYDRLLARIFLTDPHGWMVKGGQALLCRYPKARHTRDLDLLYRPGQPKPADLHDAVAKLRAAAALDLDDHLRFSYLDTKTLFKGSHTCRVRFTAYCGATAMQTISVDLVAGHTPFGQATTRALQPAVPDMGITGWPEVQLYPIIDHAADKICAMYEIHRGIVSSRYRDLADLLLIALRETIDGAELHTALRAEAARRQAREVDLTLPDVFRLPDTTWRTGYPAKARGVPGLEDLVDINAAERFAAQFMNPLLLPGPPGRWFPGERRWRELR